MTNDVKQAKSRWGIGVAGLSGAFVLFMLVLVFIASTQQYDLVEADYFQREVEYQNRIDEIKRAQAIDAGPIIQYRPDLSVVEIRFPDSLTADSLGGTVTFYRPSNSRWDTTYDISLNREGLQLISASQLVPGLWRVKVNWKVGSDSYYSEVPLNIQRATR